MLRKKPGPLPEMQTAEREPSRVLLEKEENQCAATVPQSSSVIVVKSDEKERRELMLHLSNGSVLQPARANPQEESKMS